MTSSAATPETAGSQQEDLQARLAKRLRQVDTGERAVSSWMAVEIGPRALLIPLSHASELLAWQRPAPVPYTQPWFMGIVNWRGELSGVVDLATYLDADTPRRTEQALAQCRLLTFNPALEINAALLVDRMGGLKSSGDFTRAHAPRRDNPWSFLGNFFIDHEAKAWQELNLQTLAQQPDFLSIRT